LNQQPLAQRANHCTTQAQAPEKIVLKRRTIILILVNGDFQPEIFNETVGLKTNDSATVFETPGTPSVSKCIKIFVYII
jgi:hypothetical protein